MARTRIDSAGIFMGASYAGLAGLVLLAGGAVPGAPLALDIIGTLLVSMGSLAMLATRRADEYTEGLWNAGASVAFGVMLVNFFGLGFAEGLIDGLRGSEARQDIPAQIIPLLAIIGFYIGLFAKRVLGDG